MKRKVSTLDIGKDYKIGADTYNIILYERHTGTRKSAVGKDVWDEAGYFSTVQNAFDFLVEHEVKKTELKDLTTVCDRIEKIKSWIHSLPALTIRSESVEQGKG